MIMIIATPTGFAPTGMVAVALSRRHVDHRHRVTAGVGLVGPGAGVRRHPVRVVAAGMVTVTRRVASSITDTVLPP